MDAYTKALKGNIWKLYILDFLSGSMFFIPIIVPFMMSTGLNLQQVFILQGVFTLASVILEIPSGYASDKWGRKNTTIVAAITSFIGIYFYAISTDFTTFLIGDIFLGIGMSFYSGTTEALVYDTLLELKDTDSYKRINGNLALSHFGAEAIMSVIGGLLVAYSLRLPVILTLIPFGLACILSFTLKEPRRHKMQEGRHLELMWLIAKKSIFHNAPLRNIILLHSTISLMTMSLFWYTQPYQTSVGLPLVYFGLIHAVIVLIGAIASKYTHSLEQYFDDRLLLTAIALTVFISFMALGYISSLWALVFFGFARIAWGILSPLTSNIINRMTTSDIRATVLSIRSFFFRGMFTLASPLLGYMADVLTINQAILITGIVGGILIVITFFSMSFMWKKI
jgi:MFS family permease